MTMGQMFLVLAVLLMVITTNLGFIPPMDKFENVSDEASSNSVLKYTQMANKSYAPLPIKDSIAIPGCPSEEIVDQSMYDVGDFWFPAKWVFIDGEDEIGPNGNVNYWLSPNYTSGETAYFTIDLGCVMTIAHVILKNTHNAWHNDRGTAKFTISYSTFEQGPWNTLLMGQLRDVRNQNIVEEEHFEATGTGRYVRFQVDSFYGYGGGLQYISIISGDDIKYKTLGCFEDFGCERKCGEVRDLPSLVYKGPLNTYESCREACYLGGWKYAGLEVGNECWCGHDRPTEKPLPDEECSNQPCSGNPNQMTCGSNWRIYVFELF